MRVFNLKAEGMEIINADFISPRKVMLTLSDGIDPAFAAQAAEMINFGSEIYVDVLRRWPECGADMAHMPLVEVCDFMEKTEHLIVRSIRAIREAEKLEKK